MVGTTASASISRWFDAAFPLVGFFSSVFVACLLMSKKVWLPFLVLASFSTLWISLTLVPDEETQYVAAMLFGPMRTLMWASYYRILGTNPELYDPTSVGRTIGYNGVVVALIGDGLAPVLMHQCVTGSDQAARYTRVRVMLLIAIIITTFSLPAFLYQNCATKRSSSSSSV